MQGQLLRVKQTALETWQVFVCLMEDWCLGTSILRRYEEARSTGTLGPPDTSRDLGLSDGNRGKDKMIQSHACHLFEIDFSVPQSHWEGEILPYLRAIDSQSVIGERHEASNTCGWRVRIRVKESSEAYCMHCL